MSLVNLNLDSATQIGKRISMKGRLQGIGLRPAVARLAIRYSLFGWVSNSLDGVEIEIEGATENIMRFESDLLANLPDAAEVTFIDCARVSLSGFGDFRMKMSPQFHQSEARIFEKEHPMAALVPPDVTVCEKCLAEINDQSNRRYAYPFTSCTDCGPRLSIIQRMPYEREQTGMASFPLCEQCTKEYESATDRRFHAQTTTCSDCGPQVWLNNNQNQTIARKKDAIIAAAHGIRNGRILSFRGLGGYQLMVDAYCNSAVTRLRKRKHRAGKPFAVMVRSLHEASQIANLSEIEKQVLRSPSGPIVVAIARQDSKIANSVSGELNTVGILLPTTPLHSLLIDAVGGPIVCTSANVESNPLIYESEDARINLIGIADLLLEHDRPITLPIDDSVVRVIASRPVTLRLGRGYAPLPLQLDSDHCLIATGGHQKAAFALSNGRQTVLGPHTGELESVETIRRYQQQSAVYSDIYGIRSADAACDQHPDYFTTQWAENQSSNVTRIQHHHAHIVAGMLENNWLSQEVIGVAFDGTGYGPDDTIWGGEFLLSTNTQFERVGSLRPFLLAGGERAVREPWRAATALVRDAINDDAAAKLNIGSGKCRSLLPVLSNPKLSVTTTSAGRLFDGVAALTLGIERCEFEGQAAMQLESACDQSEKGQYSIPIVDGPCRQLDWRPLIRQILSDSAASEPPGNIAMRFHRGLAEAIIKLCASYSPLAAVLGGGVFQNRVLVELLAEGFEKSGQPLGLPGVIPPNDGGLAAGQIAIASALAQQWSNEKCV